MKDNVVDDEAKAGEAGEMRDALLEPRPLSRSRPSQGRPQSYTDPSSACRMKAESLCQDREKLVPSAKSSASKTKDALPPSELRIDGSLRNWPYVFDHGEQMGKTLEEAPIYACHLIYSHNSGTPIIDPVLRTALARFSTIVPRSPNGLANDLDREASTSQDENENSVFNSGRSGNIKIALKLSEYPDYLINFGRWSGHRLSTVPDSYAFWLIEQAIKKNWMGDPLLIGALYFLHHERFVDPELNQASMRYQKIYGNRPDSWCFEDSKTQQTYLLSKSQALVFFGLELKHLEILPKFKILMSRHGVTKSVSAYELDDVWYVTSVHKSISGARHGVRSFLRSKNDSKALKGWKRDRWI